MGGMLLRGRLWNGRTIVGPPGMLGNRLVDRRIFREPERKGRPRALVPGNHREVGGYVRVRGDGDLLGGRVEVEE